MRSEFFSSGVIKIANCIPATIVSEATKTVNHFLQSNTNKVILSFLLMSNAYSRMLQGVLYLLVAYLMISPYCNYFMNRLCS